MVPPSGGLVRSALRRRDIAARTPAKRNAPWRDCATERKRTGGRGRPSRRVRPGSALVAETRGDALRIHPIGCGNRRPCGQPPVRAPAAPPRRPGRAAARPVGRRPAARGRESGADGTSRVRRGKAGRGKAGPMAWGCRSRGERSCRVAERGGGGAQNGDRGAVRRRPVARNDVDEGSTGNAPSDRTAGGAGLDTGRAGGAGSPLRRSPTGARSGWLRQIGGIGSVCSVGVGPWALARDFGGVFPRAAGGMRVARG